MRKGRRNKGCIVMATVLLAALLGGCSFLSKEADATEVSSEAETESPGATQESETETTETEETQESHEAAEDEESGEEETEDHFVEKKIVVATDMHYFAEKLAGNRCDSFFGMARGGDGRVLEYGWEVMDAFLDDMKEEDPDLLILSGDLTLDGEKASHEELAELLEGLSEAGIEVAVIPVRPLGMVASGGELSRIMLAIKTVLAETDQVPTLIFDEIDTGISGRTAQMVSEKLRILSKCRQVICITHLPQIAAMADQHFEIRKSASDGRTATSIRALDREAMVDELARLLGGAEITETVRQNAEEMKKLAKERKLVIIN